MPSKSRPSDTRARSAPCRDWGPDGRTRARWCKCRGTASRIAATRFRKAAEESEAVRNIVVRYGEMLLIQVQQTAACNALHAVEARLSRWLLQARDRLESNTIQLTHEFLSQMLGVRRTTVTVVAHMLQQAGPDPLSSRANRDHRPAGSRGEGVRMLRGHPRAGRSDRSGGGETDREAEWAAQLASPIERRRKQSSS